MAKIITFWKPEQPYGEFSQWYQSEFKHTKIPDNLDFNFVKKYYKFFTNYNFNNAEQFMMASKALLFDDEKTFSKIMYEKDPSKQKKLGRQVKNFDEKIWNENAFDIVTIGNYLKFSQNEKLKKKLLETDKHIIAEASPYDKIWGIGLGPTNLDCLDVNKWKGMNLLGKSLMKVRDILFMNEN